MPLSAVQDPHSRDAEAVLHDLATDADAGLTTAEVRTRQEQFGPNALRSTPPPPWWRKVLAQFQDPLVYLLLAAIAISLVAWLLEGAEGIPVDATVILAILVLNATIGFVQESKAADAVAALARMTVATSSVVRDGEVHAVPSAELVPGDILVLGEGDAVGADARLVTAAGLKAQEASLTGESLAVVKDPAPVDSTAALGDRTSMLYKGTAVVEGGGRAVVTSTGMSTEMGAIAGLLDSTTAEPSPLERQLAKVSRTLGLVVVGIALLVMAVLAVASSPETSEDWVSILLLGVSLAVAAVPEGLLAILSLVLALGVRAMARDNAVLKDLHSVETLGAASVICSDKTGTLTRNEMTLRSVTTASGRLELSGTGYAPNGDASVVDGDPHAVIPEARVVLIGGALANNASLTKEAEEWEIHGDPTEAAFLVAEGKVDEIAARVAHYERLGEVPFTSDRKMMSVLSHHDARDEYRIYAKGAPDVLLQRCRSERVGEDAVPLEPDRRAAISGSIDALSASGFRTLGVAYRILGEPAAQHEADMEEDLVYAGTVAILDPPREEAKEAVTSAHRAEIRSIMITGDHPVTAQRIAADLGIIEEGGRVLTGTELDDLDDAEFAAAAKDTNVFARVAPRHKLRIVDVLQSQGEIVAMTGDGVNDAPALKSADVGVAMGRTGTEVTKEAARMILADDNFATIVAAVRQGRVIFSNISKFLRYLLSSNMGEVATVFFGVALAAALGLQDESGRLLLPLLATQILWINLVTDSGPALAMGVDPEIDDVMARPPRRRDDPILDRYAWARIIWVGLVMGAVTLFTIDLYLPGGLIEGTESPGTARTAGFTTLVLAQLINAFCARSLRRSAFRGLLVNRWLLGAVVLGTVLQIAVVHVPFLQAAFGTEPLTLTQWAVCLALASVVLWTQELVKLVRHWSARA